MEGERRLNLYCVGRGSPTVLLDAGAGESMMVWRHVQGAVSAETRVCAYDRAGYGFSDASSSTADLRATVSDLRRLITAAALGPGIIYVGHSAAALYGTVLASDTSPRVAGLVLIDPAFPEATHVTEAPLSTASRTSLRAYYRETLRFLDRCLQLAETGTIARAGSTEGAPCLDTRGYADRLPPSLEATLRRQYTEPKLWRAARAEYGSLWPDRDGVVRTDRVLAEVPLRISNTPLTVLLRDGSRDPTPPGRTDAEQQAVEAARQRGVRALAARARNSRVELVRETSHHIQFDQPQRVIDAIRDMIVRVRGMRSRHVPLMMHPSGDHPGRTPASQRIPTTISEPSDT